MKNLKNKQFGKLVVIKYLHNNKYGSAMWKCKCACGNVLNVRGSNLTTGNTTQCKQCASKTHGMSNTRIYNIWRSMKTRCSNDKQPNYKRYGDRGIKFDKNWNKFENFYNDMKDGYSDNLTLERIDNSKGYSKNNCKWVTPAQQNRNMRTNINVIYNGIKYCLTDLAKIFNVSRQRLYALHNKGYEGKELIEHI